MYLVNEMIFEKKILNMYKRIMLVRHDSDGSIFFFSREDFPGLLAEDFSFLGNNKQKLNGHFYYRGQKRTDRLVFFEHGMGNGHVAYMNEINLLTEHGYTVFTYDHTGTRSSEGEHIGGFSQSLADLDHAIKAVRSIPLYREVPISVIGHSWGGFSTMNSPAIDDKITHVIALAGFISVKAIQHQAISGLLKPYRSSVYELEKKTLSSYCTYNALKTLKNTSTKALIIHSKDDPVVSFKQHFEVLRREFGTSDNIEFIELNGKEHNPNYTVDAVKYKNEYFKALKTKKKKKTLSTDEEKQALIDAFDWKRMTAQDMSLWDKIFDFLEK